jgi:hypothetical protein
MTSRGFAAGIVLACTAALFVPVETRAGSWGHGTAAPMAARGVTHPSVAHFPEMRFRHHSDFPVGWSYAPIVSTEYPTEPAAPYPAPAYPPAPTYIERAGPPPGWMGPRCRTDRQKVPRESGGETTINITRCY